MWYFNMKYGDNCKLGLHFYDIYELINWLDSHLLYYLKVDQSYDLHIFYKEEKED